jgi:hypothetical protein
VRRTPFGAPASYRQAIAEIDRAIADARERAEARADEWLMHEILARKYLSRARLSGSYDDYARAQRALDHAFAVASPGTGPHLTQAGARFLDAPPRQGGALSRCRRRLCRASAA